MIKSRPSFIAYVFATCIIISAQAKPLVVVQLEGYDWISAGAGAVGIAQLNSELRNQLLGQNYFSKTFTYDDLNGIERYVGSFVDANVYMIGYSRGGFHALRAAEQIRTNLGRSISAMTLIDPVRCGGTSTYGGDEYLSNCGTPYVTELRSIGEQRVPSNVNRATSYFQTGPAYTGGTPNVYGESNVVGATNVNFGSLASSPNLNHYSIIQDNARMRQGIISDVRSMLDSSRLITGLGGPSGFGGQIMSPNDDESSAEVRLPFFVRFGGSNYVSLYVNNNGNVTFGTPYSPYTPTGFAGLSVPMMAPFWADVDTRCPTCGAVYYARPAADTVVVTWNKVGYYAEHADKVNTFQMIIRNRDDIAPTNNMDIEYRYGSLQWTTGDASDGVGGLGGTPAYAGYTASPGSPAQTLTGSGTGSVLSLQALSNLGTPGRWGFSFRAGLQPGATQANPLLGVLVGQSASYTYATATESEMVWASTYAAVELRLQAFAGTLFSGFTLEATEGLFQLLLPVNGELQYFADIAGGAYYSFSDITNLSGITSFGLRHLTETPLIAIRSSQAAQAELPLVIGLTFDSVGVQTWSQEGVSAVPDAPTAWMFLLGVLVLIRRLARPFRMKRLSPTARHFNPIGYVPIPQE